MTKMEPTKETSSCRTVRRLLTLAGAMACGLVVAARAHQLRDGSRPGLRQASSPSTSNTLQSWLSFNKQTGSLGFTSQDVVQVNAKAIQHNDHSDDESSSSHDQDIQVKVIEYKDPDVSESGTDEFTLEFEGNEDFDHKVVEAALSKALKSGLRDPEEIAKVVSENLKHHKKKKVDHNPLPQQESLTDKP